MDKATYITFDLKVRAGTGVGTPSYNKHMWTFDEGTPQECMELLSGLQEIWQQNTVNGAHDRAATVAAVLKGDSQIAFEAAMGDARVDPNAAVPIPLTVNHVKVSLCAVTTIVFPFRALETQKQWMNKYMKKLYNLSTKMMMTALSRINNYLPSFLDGDATCKECGKNSTHDTDRCYVLKWLAREKEAKSNGNGKAYAKPFSKRTFCKEVNSIARCAGKHDGLKIVESALKHKQGKLQKHTGRTSSKKNTKASAKKSCNDNTSLD
jgi:hypothetical protein